MSFRKVLIENKWWWIVPIVLVLALVGFILAKSGSGTGGDDNSPFQYDAY